MLKELTIKNFFLFKDLDIKGLKRINLIAGKNNSGKTALLEALRLLAAGFDTTVVNHVLNNRGQFTNSWDSSYDALFNRNLLEQGNNILRINEYSVEKQGTNSKKGWEYRVRKEKANNWALDASIVPDYPKDQSVFLPFMGDTKALLGLWKKIALTDLEDEVVHLIRETVEPRLIRMDIRSEGTKVRLEGESSPVPLSTLGDGVTRVLLFALALVGAKGKQLLIDEFEVGLHYSIQEKLWKLAFQYAQKWDIQMFITTHSQDSIRAFYYVASIPNNQPLACFLRLQENREGKLEAINYPIERLEDAMEMNLEIR